VGRRFEKELRVETQMKHYASLKLTPWKIRCRSDDADDEMAGKP
jgi:hypothetical protein